MIRLKFLKELGSELVQPAIKTRPIPPRTGIPISVQAAMETVIGPLPQQIHTPRAATSRTGKRNRYAFCPGQKTPNIEFGILYALHTYTLNTKLNVTTY